MYYTIQLKGGVENDIPTLKPRELGVCTDTNKVYIGSESGNIDFFKSINDKLGGVTKDNTVKSQLDNLTSNKAEKNQLNLRSYTNLSQLGINESTTLLNVIQKLPVNSMIAWDYKSLITCTDTAPDGTGYGTMIILKYSSTRIILFYQSKDGYLYNTTANNANADTTYVNEWQLLSITDSGFQDLPLASGVSNYASYDTAKYRKLNKTVKLTGRVTGLTGTSGTIGTLPNGFRPIQNSMFTTLTNGVKLINVMIDKDGIIKFNAKDPLQADNFITLDGIIFDI